MPLPVVRFAVVARLSKTMNTAIREAAAVLKDRGLRPWAAPERIPRPGLQSSPAATSKRPIRLLLIDDHPVVLHGLSSCLARCANIKIVGQVTDSRDAVRSVKELSPDVALLDISMPTMNGFDVLRTLQTEAPRLKVLVLTFYDSPDYLLRTLRSGAQGYLLKNASPEHLQLAIEAVYAGDTFFSSHLSQEALKRIALGNGQGPQTHELSNREREILIAISEGLSNKEISARFGIAVRTVETHRERMMNKLGIHTIAGLTQFAVKTGLVSVTAESEALA